MIDKIKALWELMQKGKSVADPALWKSRQITVTMLGGLIIAAVQLAKVFGYELPVDENTASAIAGGVLAVTNVFLTLSTSDKVGVGAKQENSDLPTINK